MSECMEWLRRLNDEAEIARLKSEVSELKAQLSNLLSIFEKQARECDGVLEEEEEIYLAARKAAGMGVPRNFGNEPIEKAGAQ